MIVSSILSVISVFPTRVLFLTYSEQTSCECISVLRGVFLNGENPSQENLTTGQVLNLKRLPNKGVKLYITQRMYCMYRLGSHFGFGLP